MTAINGKNQIVKKEQKDSTGRKIMSITSKTYGINFESILAKLMQYANVVDALSHVEKKMKYVVQIPIKYEEAIQSGEMFINQNSKTGVMWPTLYKVLDTGKRQFVDNMPIKPEQIIHGNPFERIAISQHNLYIQQNINDLAEIMEQTRKAIERIEQGQLSDRIGLLLAGKDQILLALHSDPEKRMMPIECGRSNMLTAQKQFLQTFKSKVENFEEIPKTRWSRFWIEVKHGEFFKQRYKEFSDIQEYYRLYLKATYMVATSYAICGQKEAAQQVFEIAEQDMKEINFEALKTLSFIHKNDSNMLYYHADEYVATEREICMNEIQEYDTISIEVSGAKLLEVFQNGKTHEIPKAEPGQ